MARPEPLDLTTAELRLGGYNYRLAPDGRKEVTFRHWTIVTADGQKFNFCQYKLRWNRWVIPAEEAHRAAHWRKANKAQQAQLTKWLRAHPDYVSDAPANRFILPA